MDSDVALLYAVETKRVNEAVKNNPDKFPEGYLIELTADEWEPMKSKFSTSIKGGKTKSPKAFTEKGLYMLATILKSEIAELEDIQRELCNILLDKDLDQQYQQAIILGEK